MRSGSPPSPRSVLLGVCVSLAAAGCGREAPDLLLVAPFAEGVTLAQDDPDTLRVQLRPAVGRLSLVPRGASDPAQVAAAVAEEEPAILWLRVSPDPTPWLRALPSDWKGLVVHSIAWAHRDPNPAFRDAVDRDPDMGPRGRAILWARPVTSDETVAAYAEALLREWASGATLEAANEAAAAAVRRQPWRLDGNRQLTVDELHSGREARSSAD